MCLCDVTFVNCASLKCQFIIIIIIIIRVVGLVDTQNVIKVVYHSCFHSKHIIGH